MTGKELVEELRRRDGEAMHRGDVEPADRLSDAIAALIDAGVYLCTCWVDGQAPCSGCRKRRDALARCEAELKPAETRDLGEQG